MEQGRVCEKDLSVLRVNVFVCSPSLVSKSTDLKPTVWAFSVLPKYTVFGKQQSNEVLCI